MKKTNIFKVAALTAVFAVAGMFANAQNIGTGTISTPDGPVVKVIDNKGTVKYFQSNNGITTITSTAPGQLTTTTWQLGGTLDTATYINTDGKIFGLMGLLWNTDTASTGGTTAGYSLLVRDEATGRTMKRQATDLIQAGQELFIATDNLVTYTLTSGVVLPLFNKVYVYRNGAKLIADIDYDVAGSVITLNPSNPNENFTIYAGDKIEVHYIK